LRLKFCEILKPAEGNRLYLLYSSFHTYSLHIPRDESIFGQGSAPQLYSSQGQFSSIEREVVSLGRARICLREAGGGMRRSEYRNIDHDHPSKEI
jgi:hypothetical protein